VRVARERETITRQLAVYKEKINMKRTLLILAASVLFLNTFIVTAVARVDGGVGGTNCGKTLCKP
jgi:hypothetical protein